MKNILLPTDFSKNSKHAIEFALRLFPDKKINFHIINAYFPPVTGPDMIVSLNEMLKKQALKSMSKLVKDLQKQAEFKNLTITRECLFGDVEYVVEKQSIKTNADLVVMGTKGASGLQEVLVGSHTSAVMARLNTPFLIIPEKAKNNKINKVLISFDFEKVRKDVLNPVIEIMKKDNSTFFVLNIHPKDKLLEEKIDNIKQTFSGKLKGFTHDYYFLENNNIEDGIVQFITDHNIDLAVMIKRERSFLEKLFHKSITKKMSMHADIPLLILPE